MNLTWDQIDACLFDLDGVLTPTAEVHMRAWAEMFNDFLTARGVTDRYTDRDYFDHVDGKPRYEGVADFLASRGIELPYGDPSDPDDAQTVCGLGNRKDRAFNAVLKRDGIEPYATSMTFLDRVRDAGLRTAVVSSSKNAAAVLEMAGIADRIEVVVSGKEAAELGLPGKPKPDTFQHAADQLGVAHDRSVVFEDALSGVRAGAAGGFAAVVGVDRGTGAERLREAGATVVVQQLDELDPR
ncbi:beta-phosphoglucomutase family hydrolase [Mariniluteicoccus endophyticus]